MTDGHKEIVENIKQSIEDGSFHEHTIGDYSELKQETMVRSLLLIIEIQDEIINKKALSKSDKAL